MTVKLGLVGTGTVGGGCIDILKNHREDFKRHYGIDVELVRVCSRNPEQAIAHGVEDIFTQDYQDILNDPDIDIVVELIGGTTVARDIVVGALKAGKNVVTANKALMATYGEEVMGAADEAGKEIAFEASVGGGIPIIDPMKHSLIANEISSVMGIVNGTTNYMLTRMVEDGLSYDAALKEAQEKGCWPWEGLRGGRPPRRRGRVRRRRENRHPRVHRVQLARDHRRRAHRGHPQRHHDGLGRSARHGLLREAAGAGAPHRRGRGRARASHDAAAVAPAGHR